ncbi:MDIS1-interacting receptor like kinase 2-like [Camellia sinensis]|uniref:MDIS1-interacting receptor like kinase 2-like n=1 Tax=Camellia sinensis TaxID=4442 RepID=UPI00103648EE|nr:MDIS1-interacting receptor like kinase 2-like [Camellia sinensis]
MVCGCHSLKGIESCVSKYNIVGRRIVSNEESEEFGRLPWIFADGDWEISRASEGHLIASESDQREATNALLTWKTSLQSTNDSLLTSWVLPPHDSGSTNASPCNLFGVSCNLDGSVIKLNLTSSSFFGPISISLTNLRNLTHLYLYGNDLFGSIPPEMGNLVNLVKLYMDGNNLTGTIPSTLGNLNNLTMLHLFNHSLFGSIHQDRTVEITTGPNLSGQQSYWLNPNIVRYFGELLKFVLLEPEQQHVQPENSIKDCFIPKSFEDMRGLAYIDISYNQLQGHIPLSNAFINASMEALQGNKGPCGNVKGLQPCEILSTMHKHTLENGTLVLIIVLSLGEALLLLGAFIRLLIIFNSRKRKSRVKKGDTQTSIEDLLSILILDGRAMYNDNKLHPLSERADRKDFLNGVRALTEIKHRNIVNLFGFCSYARYSFLVYEYIERDSLVVIFNKDEEAKELDCPKRVNIIKGVASALSYMHHDCTPSIVHLDISSNNVLIDEEYGGHILDFGTAKLLKLDSSN